MLKRFFTNKWIYSVLAILILFIVLGGDDTAKEESAEALQASNDLSYTSELKSDSHQVKLKGNRLLGVGINSGSIGFDAAFPKAQELGVEVVELVSHWDEGEKKVGEYSDQWLEIANSFYPQNNVSLALTINPVDTNNLRLPKYLKNKSFDDREVIEAYKKYVSYLAGLIPDSDVVSVSVGNEVNAYLGTNNSRWEEYTTFVCEVVPHVRSVFPEAKVGVKIMLESLFGNQQEAIITLNSCTDVVMLNYYPLTDEFLVREPTVVHTDFDRVTVMFPNDTIFISETGYPSGEISGSSQKKQADFFREALTAWDNHANQILLMNIIWLHDIPQAELKGYETYYGSGDERFLSFLGTLGIRTNSGKDKEAYNALIDELNKRGW